MPLHYSLAPPSFVRMHFRGIPSPANRRRLEPAIRGSRLIRALRERAVIDKPAGGEQRWFSCWAEVPPSLLAY